MNEVENAISQLASQAVERKKENERTQRQRRNQVMDNYGIEYQSQGDANAPAIFYVSISPDLIYYERFEFKLIIDSFRLPIKDGKTNATASQVENTALSITNNAISPNPHGHRGIPHDHEISAGITLDNSVGDQFELWMDGIDLTTALKKQHGGSWVNGTGVFPETANQLGNYDVLKALEDLHEWQRGVVLKPGFKKIELRGQGVFNATLINYLKYSHVNR